MNLKKQFTEGLITNNPVLVQRIGLCSTMAITTMFFNGIGMGLSVLIILTCCNVVISAMRKVIPNDIRLAMFVVVIAGFVTIVDPVSYTHLNPPSCVKIIVHIDGLVKHLSPLSFEKQLVCYRPEPKSAAEKTAALRGGGFSFFERRHSDHARDGFGGYLRCV